MGLVKKEVALSSDWRHRLPFAAPIFPWRLGLNYRDQSMDGIGWLVCPIVVLVRHRYKGLWFLVGLPFVLYWPARLPVIP
jgi:hypothetical protein